MKIHLSLLKQVLPGRVSRLAAASALLAIVALALNGCGLDNVGQTTSKPQAP